jgi:hypothetical protein
MNTQPFVTTSKSSLQCVHSLAAKDNMIEGNQYDTLKESEESFAIEIVQNHCYHRAIKCGSYFSFAFVTT